MSELVRLLESLALRLDRMGLRVQQAVADAIKAVRAGDDSAGEKIDADDTIIDREEVEIERECIRLLALHQPAAVDLREIFFIVKANNDLERIADLAARIGRRAGRLAAERIRLDDYPQFMELAAAVTAVLGDTVGLLRKPDIKTATSVIASDMTIDMACGNFIRTVLDRNRSRPDGIDATLTLSILARTMERIGDHCTNIAEDAIFLSTGDIVRHTTIVKDPGG